MATTRFLISNGVVLRGTDAPPVTTFLETRPGAYTTTRSADNASCILFWERHLKRLAHSIRYLSNSSPWYLSKSKIPNDSPAKSSIASISWESAVRNLVNDSTKKVLPIALQERANGEELAITALVGVNFEKLSDNRSLVDEDSVVDALDVHVHIGAYLPRKFGVQGSGAHLAMVGRGRDAAAAKYSDWVRSRKVLEKLRPPLVTELLLSNDGDRILEGCVTNFFVVSRKVKNEEKDMHSGGTDCFEVQTSPVSEGVLTGVIRQLVIEACLSKGISFREVAASWSGQELWEEAFVTSSLRIMEHAERILVPRVWEPFDSKTWTDISWKEKRFQDGPGLITKLIQEEVMNKAGLERYPIENFI